MCNADRESKSAQSNQNVGPSCRSAPSVPPSLNLLRRRSGTTMTGTVNGIFFRLSSKAELCNDLISRWDFILDYLSSVSNAFHNDPLTDHFTVAPSALILLDGSPETPTPGFSELQKCGEARRRAYYAYHVKQWGSVIGSRQVPRGCDRQSVVPPSPALPSHLLRFPSPFRTVFRSSPFIMTSDQAIKPHQEKSLTAPGALGLQFPHSAPYFSHSLPR